MRQILRWGALPNVWLGTSVENQRWASERIAHLFAAPAVVRFLSCEPLLGPLDLTPYLANGSEKAEWFLWRYGTSQPLSWVIVGGESGAGHRPFNPDWADDIRRQCQDAGVAFFFKQHGGRTPKAGGRLLDGQEWNEFPGEVA